MSRLLPGQYARVWRLAWPIILSNLTVPLLGAVDTAVVGHLQHAYYLGAVGIGAMIFTFVYWGMGFLRMGTAGLAAQAFGAGDGDEVRAVLVRALMLAGGLGILLILLQWPISRAAFALIDGTEQVEALAADYFDIRIWAAPGALANYCLLGWFVALQRTGFALVLEVAMNGLNILLDLVFVIGFGWDVKGVALATAISEWSAVAIGLPMALVVLRGSPGRISRVSLLNPVRIRRLLSVNRDIFIRTACLVSALAYFTARAATLGDVALAATVVMTNFLHFLAFGLDGFAYAAQALVGGALGSRDREDLKTVIRTTTVWAVLVSTGYVVVYALIGPILIDILTGLEPVRAQAREFLPWLVAAPLIAVWAYQFDGIFVGATMAREMRNTMLFAVLVYALAMAAFGDAAGGHGLWAALVIFLGARGATMAFVMWRSPVLHVSER